MSIAAFCRKRGLSSSTFHYWQRRFRAESLDGQADADPSGFVRVEAAVGPESPVEAHLPCGTTLRVPAERLEELVRVLRKEGV